MREVDEGEKGEQLCRPIMVPTGMSILYDNISSCLESE